MTSDGAKAALLGPARGLPIIACRALRRPAARLLDDRANMRFLNAQPSVDSHINRTGGGLRATSVPRAGSLQCLKAPRVKSSRTFEYPQTDDLTERA